MLCSKSPAAASIEMDPKDVGEEDVGSVCWRALAARTGRAAAAGAEDAMVRRKEE